MTVTLRRLTFSCPLSLLIIYVLVLTLLINLGFWQLKRAEEKRALIAQQTQTKMAKPVALLATTDDNVELLRYRKVLVTGHYDTAQQFLCDNQIVNGKAGYFVLTPFILEGEKKAVLVNRGWIAANPNRNILPDVGMKSVDLPDFKNLEGLAISGRINTFPSVGIKLAGADIPTNTSPAVVQVVNSQVLAKKLGYPLFPFQVELDPTMTEGYTRQWLTTMLMSPEQHVGYAIQWFGLAVALTLLFFWYSSKKTNP